MSEEELQQIRLAVQRLANVVDDLIGWLTPAVVPVSVAKNMAARVDRAMQELEGEGGHGL